MSALLTSATVQTNTYVRLPADIAEHYLHNPVLQQFLMTSVGFRDSTANIGHVVRREPRNEYLMMYCIQGMGWLEIENKKWAISPGDLFLCDRGIFNSYGADKEDPWTIYWSYFTGNTVSSLFELIGVTVNNPIFHIGEDPEIISAFAEVLDMIKKGYTLQILLCCSNCLQKVLSLLSLRVMYSKSGSGTLSDRTIEDAISYMLENINDGLKLDQLVVRSNMSKDSFCKVFKDKTGYTPIDYFIRLKMQKACTLLNTTNLRINEISCRLGYEDVYYFSRVFKKKVGYSPRRYRNVSCHFKNSEMGCRP